MKCVPLNNETEIHNKIFSASRLSLARKLRGLTKIELSKLIGITPGAISNYENAKISPLPDTTKKIAKALSMNLSFFYNDEIDCLPEAAFSFRSRRSMTAKLRDKSISFGELAREQISPKLNQLYVLPKVDVPDLGGFDPEHAAHILRASWGLGDFPISNMVHLLESKGVEVYWLNEDSPYVDAFSFQSNGKPFILLNQYGKSGDRDRFNAAHELGHLVLHQHKDSLEDKNIEAEAHRFAGALLLPEMAFRQDCPRQPILEHFFELKKKWGASIAAMIRRGYDLEIFSQWQYHTAFKELSIRKWRHQEPAHCALHIEDSLLHKKIFEDLKSKNVTPLGLARSIDLDLEILSTLMPACKNTLELNEPIHLRLVS